MGVAVGRSVGTKGDSSRIFVMKVQRSTYLARGNQSLADGHRPNLFSDLLSLNRFRIKIFKESTRFDAKVIPSLVCSRYLDYQALLQKNKDMGDVSDQSVFCGKSRQS